MGPGIRPLPYFHPLQVATDCAVCDHLTNGRYLAGFGLGIGGIGEPRGKMPGPLREISHEAIDLILKAWTSTEPFDWNGKYWQGKQWQIIPKPLSKPHMDVGIACTNSDSTLAIAAEKGFLPLFTWTQTPDKTAQMIKTYLETPSAAVKPDRSRARVARFVYVADSVDQARRDLHECDVGAAKLGRLDQYIPVGGTRADLTMERLMDQEVFCIGDPDSVTQQIRRLYHETGGFGVLLLVCGKEWGTWEQRQRSWRMFMRDVAPRLGDLDGNRPAH
jgi:alkanesulfonate monooxygenase SsuD/methylene tetrahydromethanopterin reductase-like flavin-dependent oxidoreductase (luciferase family)